MIVGIDLGTTNSLIAAWQDGEARLIPNATGSVMTPSVVGVDDDGRILVGAAARERQVTHPELTTAAFKRYMGTDRKLRIGKHELRAEELSAFVLRALKADAEAQGEAVDEAVVTVPAYFNDAQRKATRAACQLAGLKVERLLNEPTAAALAYGLHRRQIESKFLVFDLGGGTFDVSLLELFDGVFEVRATAGDNFLGGEDFADILVEGFVDHTDSRKALASPAFRAVVRDRAERAKRALTREPSARMSVTWEGQELAWTLDENRFLELAAPLLSRLRAPVERSLRDARIRASELDETLLIGGATRMPLVRRMVAQMFGRIPASNIDPDTTVCLGAAVQAGLKARDQALEEMVMTDVAPYSLGVSVVRQVSEANYEEGRFLPLIERNTVIPASRMETLYPVHEQQKVVEVEIYQGESRLVVNNILLGTLKVDLPDARTTKDRRLDVRFTYDINGLLEVHVKLASGASRRLIIEGNPGVLTPAQVEQRLQELAKLKVHPRDQTENRALLARAERLYEESLGEQREGLARLIDQFAGVLARQDPRAIAQATVQFRALLDRIEGEAPW